MNFNPNRNPERPQYNLSVAVVIIVALGGFLVLALVMGILLLGLTLDRALNTRPLFTIGLMILSAPVSIFVMYRVAMSVISRTTFKAETKHTPQGDSRP
jgi:F0F1-type ATP synthase assembly protein I